MKVLVLSDSHSAVKQCINIIELEKPDRVLHLGDCVEDFNKIQQKYPQLPMLNVAGNCDPFALDVPDSRLITWEGVRIFMTHGHLQSVKYNYQRLVYAALEMEAALVLFGHTHVPVSFFESGMQFLNPGSARQRAYGMLDLNHGTAACTLKVLE